jgi:EpsD family peptidyl-prolyl cis-trans isomerase
MNIPRHALIAALPVLGAVLAGCDGRSNNVDLTPVAARVNGTPIPVSRLGASTERARAPGRTGAASTLERAIDQELLVQAALEAKLDRDPRVVRLLDDARRQILAQAYVDGVVAEAGEPSKQDVRDFYERNPALFANRRIYRFQEVKLDAPAEKLQLVKDQLGNAASVQELSSWLKLHAVPFSVASATKPAEQIPLNLLPRLAELRAGELALFPNGSGASVVQLVDSQDASLSEEQAAPVIAKFLSSRRRLQLAQEAVGRLRGRARIEYAGEHHPATQNVPPGGAASRTSAVLTESNGVEAAEALLRLR